MYLSINTTSLIFFSTMEKSTCIELSSRFRKAWDFHPQRFLVMWIVGMINCAHKECISPTQIKFIGFIIGIIGATGRRHVERNARFRFVRHNVRLNGSYYKSREKARLLRWRAPIFPKRSYQPSLTYKKCVKRKAQAGAWGDFDARRRSVPHSFSTTWISTSYNIN